MYIAWLHSVVKAVGLLRLWMKYGERFMSRYVLLEFFDQMAQYLGDRYGHRSSPARPPSENLSFTTVRSSIRTT